MAHASDIDLAPADIAGLSSPDALAAFFTKLGYETSVRKELTAESLGLTGETADTIRGMELLAEDGDGFVPWNLVAEIGVANQAIASQVGALLGAGAGARRPVVSVQRGWYY